MRNTWNCGITIAKFCNRRQKIPDAYFYTSGITVQSAYGGLSSIRTFLLIMGLSGLEPPTSRLSGVRSNRLSYKPMCIISNTLHILQYFPPFVKYKLSLHFCIPFQLFLVLGSLTHFLSPRPALACFQAVSCSLFLPLLPLLGSHRQFSFPRPVLACLHSVFSSHSSSPRVSNTFFLSETRAHKKELTSGPRIGIVNE